jgi:hypothetical protein
MQMNTNKSIIIHLILALLPCIIFGFTAISHAAEADLVFLGTIEKVEASPLPQSSLNWIVHCRVDKVLSGNFANKTFSFRVHSPTKSGLEEGKQYKIKARRTTDGYTVDQYQWGK